MAKVLMKGNEAIGEAAIRAGCKNYFAYPITPQSEVAEYLAKRLPEVDGVFLQGESEVAVGYMIFGAAAAGERVMTTSSSPGVSLMGEAISYIAAAQCPAVFVNIMRGGPGLGGILPSQADYFQATKGGGHGDYRLLVMAPASVQETVEMVMQAFALAGGFTEWASKKEIILLRHENGKDKIYRINYKNIVKGKDLSQNLKLKTDDTIIVP